jgi:hypothetical protein
MEGVPPKINCFFSAMSHFDEPIIRRRRKKKPLKLWRLPKIDVSIGRRSASPLAHLYIM